MPWRRRDRALRRRDRDRIQIATLAEVAQLREILTRAQYQNAEPVHPLLHQAVAAPARGGDLLRLEAGGVEFLAIVAAGTDSAESIWQHAATLAAAAGTAGQPVTGPHEVVQVAYRAFPDGLHAVGVAGRREGELLAFVSASLHPADQRAAVRRLDRSTPGHAIVPLAAPAPFALLLRHHPAPAAATALASAGMVATIATLHGSPPPPRPQPRALPVITAPTPPPGGHRPHPRPHHRHRLRDNSRPGYLQRIHALHAAHAGTPFTPPLSPVPSPSPTGLLPPIPVPAVTPARACVKVAGVKVCVLASALPVLRL